MSGAMCPSYHATKNEKDTTRGRANALREYLTHSEKRNRFDQVSLKEVFDLCLSCKACASECPSNVDVATLKAEFQYQYQEANGYPLRSKLFAYNTRLNRLGSRVAPLANAVYTSGILSRWLKRSSGVAARRSFPTVSNFNFDKHLKDAKGQYDTSGKKVILHIDEFTRYLDIELGQEAIELLSRLGYDVTLFYAESGRTFISKGFLKQARKLAVHNVSQMDRFVQDRIPIIGLEPSAILTFRDEYSRFGIAPEKIKALAANCFLIEEFLATEIAVGKVGPERFTSESRTVKIHVHCHQKALSNQKVTFDMLNLPINYSVTLISSGCCGMAGSFGYEAEHYDISMEIGELKLFPSIRKTDADIIIAANGTSCRHQIFDGTQRKAVHPVTVLKEALLD
jgi:Fe-S oxidoreductase